MSPQSPDTEFATLDPSLLGYASQAEFEAHVAATTDVHGIGDVVLEDLAAVDYVDTGDEATLLAAQTYADSPLTIETISGNYTAVLDDATKVKRQTSGSASNFTLPPAASVEWVAGTTISIIQGGAGTITVVEGAGVTTQSPGDLVETASQHSAIHCLYLGSDIWHLSGDLA